MRTLVIAGAVLVVVGVLATPFLWSRVIEPQLSDLFLDATGLRDDLALIRAVAVENQEHFAFGCFDDAAVAASPQDIAAALGLEKRDWAIKPVGGDDGLEAHIIYDPASEPTGEASSFIGSRRIDLGHGPTTCVVPD
jgi:hypothetical protein